LILIKALVYNGVYIASPPFYCLLLVIVVKYVYTCNVHCALISRFFLYSFRPSTMTAKNVHIDHPGISNIYPYMYVCIYISYIHVLCYVQRHLISCFTSILNTIMQCIIQDKRERERKERIIQAIHERAATHSMSNQECVTYLDCLL
jgi:hypothetical protein